MRNFKSVKSLPLFFDLTSDNVVFKFVTKAYVLVIDTNDKGFQTNIFSNINSLCVHKQSREAKSFENVLQLFSLNTFGNSATTQSSSEREMMLAKPIRSAL